MSTLDEETRAYLKRIQQTITDADTLISQAELRIAETDRLLASQGLTRAEVMSMHFTDQQRALVNEALIQRGLPPLPKEIPDSNHPEHTSQAPQRAQEKTPTKKQGEQQQKLKLMTKIIRI